ncbi:cytochrome P450 [Actinoallomurus soli]|uniref:cytochrome P450 n=1 Tax=Actinoallomurus soli TaxID=2952535 RepID=UPI0020929615|nr:cytochrome P450 [Actinoallomurus soli]MCO5974610.1 cytochrome P450 [Actinoallomurus soli]
MTADISRTARNTDEIPALDIDRASAVHSYKADRLGFFYAVARRYGPVVRLWPGTILVTGPEEVHAVLRNTNRTNYLDRDLRRKKPTATPGSARLNAWMSTRRTAIVGMTAEMIEEHARWLAGTAGQLSERMLQRGRIDDLMATLAGVTSASVARFCFGTRAASAIPETAQAMLDALFPIVASPYDFPEWVKLVQRREWRASRRARKMRAALLETAKSDGEGGLVDVLYGGGLDDAAVVDALTSILLAAHGVPAAATAWVLVELARHGDQQETARAAADRWVGSGPEPPELGWAVDETLRLWPASWVAGRAVSEDAACGSWTLPPGSRVVIPFWVTHRVAECYPDPERFDIRRWEQFSPPPGAYVPFGAGPRRCLGARFARTEMITIIAVLLQRLRFRIEGEVRTDARATLTPTGFELLVDPR